MDLERLVVIAKMRMDFGDVVERDRDWCAGRSVLAQSRVTPDKTLLPVDNRRAGHKPRQYCSG
jgi:hypothetical protein